MADFSENVENCFCFEDATMLALWRAAHPEAASRSFSLDTLLETQRPVEAPSPEQRLEILRGWLPEEKISEAPAYLTTLERLRESLILEPEDADYCFSCLPETPKNAELKQLLLRYLQSPLALDRTRRIWELMESLKRFEVRFELGQRLFFVHGENKTYVITELAKAFSYAAGIEEVATRELWELGGEHGSGPGPERPGLTCIASDSDAVSRLADRIVHLVRRGVPAGDIHVPLAAAPRLRAWLRLRLLHEKIPAHFFFRPPAPVPSKTPSEEGDRAALIAFIRKDARLPIARRLALTSRLISQAIGKSTRMSWEHYFKKLVVREILSEEDGSYLESILTEIPKEVPAETTAEADAACGGVLISDFTLLPQWQNRITLGLYDPGAALPAPPTPLLRTAEAEALGRAGFPVLSAVENHERRRQLLTAFLGRGPGRRLLFSTRTEGLPVGIGRPRSLLPNRAPFRLEPVSVSPPPLGNLPATPLSASQLETYAACPARYFYSYRLKLRGPEGENSPALLFGQAVHLALETYFKQGRQSSLEDHFGQALRQVAPALEPEQPLHTMLLENFRSISDLIPRLETKLSDVFGSHSPYVFEQDFSFDFEGIRLRGKIDRIDRLDDQSLVILDYKTGAVDFSPNHIAQGNHFQALIYLLAAEFLFRQPPAGVLFYDLKNGEVRRGLVRESQIAPEKKKEITRGHALNTAQFEQVKQSGIEALRTVADKIKRGEFDPKPSAVVCAYCEFASLCRQAVNHV